MTKATHSATTTRPPIVVIMGHVDHGKTTLLDYIRKANVVAKEAGGITQHIGAYQATHEEKVITFIDTPGHEAFSAIRSRGSAAADIAVLVVAADSGVQPQTEEALKHVKLAGIPYIVALNKMDKQAIKPEAVKKALAEHGVEIEEFGGKVPLIPISAKTGAGVKELLEMILLVAEVERLEAHPEEHAQGVVVESSVDPRRGATGTFLIRDGSLHTGEYVSVGRTASKVKVIEDFQGAQTEHAEPSTPVILFGLAEVPQVGERFFAGKTSEEALARSEQAAKEVVKSKTLQEGILRRVKRELPPDTRLVPLILKADVQGSLEALRDAVMKLAIPHAVLEIVEENTGPVGVADIQHAENTGAILVCFRVKIPEAIQSRIIQSNIPLYSSHIIYEVLESLEKGVAGVATVPERKEEHGEVEILASFHGKKGLAIVGGRVNTGTIKVGMRVEIVRQEKVAGTGVVEGLQQNKAEVKSVAQGRECGLRIATEMDIMVDDVLRWPAFAKAMAGK